MGCCHIDDLKLQYIIITYSVNSFEYYYYTLLFSLIILNIILIIISMWDHRPRGGSMTSIYGILVKYRLVIIMTQYMNNN